MTSASGPAFAAARTGSVITAVRVAMAEPLSYGGRPSTAAYSRAPSDHRSAGGPGFWPRARSGEMYDGAPTSMPVEVTDGSPSIWAMPKSVSTTRPSSAISTLDGFTSRCRMPASCAALQHVEHGQPDLGGALRACSGPSSRIASAASGPRPAP